MNGRLQPVVGRRYVCLYSTSALRRRMHVRKVNGAFYGAVFDLLGGRNCAGTTTTATPDRRSQAA